jgi:hypothetical protein
MKTPTYHTKITLLVICLADILLMLATGCKKEAKVAPVVTQQAVKGPFLYVGGYTSSVGAYIKISLSEPNSAIISDTIANTRRISSIVTNGSDVYMAAQAAGYWKNKSFIPMSGVSDIQFLALAGTVVYSAGFDNSASLAYWNNGIETNLGSTIGRNLFPFQGVSAFGITGMAVSTNGALLSGQLFTENEPGSPASALSGNFGLMWQNSNLQLLGHGTLVSLEYNSTAGIAVTGNDVYVAGRMPDTTYAGGYWKNGVWTAINNGAFLPYAITTSGTDVYISGYIYNSTKTSTQGVYWKNGTLNTINNALNATTLAANGSDIYIVGIDGSNNEVVWKNGTVFKVIGPISTSITPLCMAVGN